MAGRQQVGRDRRMIHPASNFEHVACRRGRRQLDTSCTTILLLLLLLLDQRQRAPRRHRDETQNRCHQLIIRNKR